MRWNGLRMGLLAVASALAVTGAFPTGSHAQVAQDEYQRLAPGARVIVNGARGRNRIQASSIESPEP